MVLPHLKDHLVLFVKKREFCFGYGFLSRQDLTLAVESVVKANSFQNKKMENMKKLRMCRLHLLVIQYF